MSETWVGLDFGTTNLKGVTWSGDFSLEKLKSWRVPTPLLYSQEHLSEFLSFVGLSPGQLHRLGVTGGRHEELPSHWNGVVLHKAKETEVIPVGALALAGLSSNTDAIVVSAGSGTAVLCTRGGQSAHVSGTGVGGGTLFGLARLLLGYQSPEELSRLASQGSTSKVDLTLAEALGGALGGLPPEATAVNFGKLGRFAEDYPKSEPADIAAGLFTMVAQVIGVIVCNVALREKLDRVIYVGHLPDFLLIREVLSRVAALYGLPLPIFPTHAGLAAAVGIALHSQR